MAESRLAILIYSGKTPSFAMCERCRLKFFTPKHLTNDPVDENLLSFILVPPKSCRSNETHVGMNRNFILAS